MENIDYNEKMLEMGKKARRAALALGAMDADDRVRCLNAMADAIESSGAEIATANAEDIARGVANGLSEALLDRLRLSPARIKGMADGLRQVAEQDEVIGRVLESKVRPNGIRIDKVTVPIGVIGIIYESRPNVTVDAAGICLKAGNVVILRGGSEAISSNLVLADILNRAGAAAGMPDGAVQLVPWTSRDAVNAMLKLDQYIDLVIPRGGEGLIRAVMREATMPVIKHYKGVCHIFIDREFDTDMALSIVENAKCQRPAVCNAIETVLFERSAAGKVAAKLYEKLTALGVKIYGDTEFNKLTGNTLNVTDEEYFVEHMDLVMCARVVDGVEQAVEHINHYGSHHSDAIISNIEASVKYFFAMTDSSTLYHNASTRFTDGGEFGMGAEIGISTDKIHARGPMGAAELTSTKFLVYGTGQIR